MKSPTQPRSGGHLLIEQLAAFGVRRVFMVPGESFLPCMDALYDRKDTVESIVCRHESGASFMAEAHGKLTGEPGICFVSRGPGATNASIGIHTAHQDSTPLIMFIGQVGSDTVDRECFQEVDYRKMYAPLAKWVAQIDRADRIPEYLSRAYSLATSGRPGPVVLALPEDMLAQITDSAIVPKPQLPHAVPSLVDMEHIQHLIEKAQAPLLVLGGVGWSPEARMAIQSFAERFDLPVATAWRRLELFDNDHPNFVGQISASMPAHQKAVVVESDLVLAVGTRLCEPTTLNYEWLESPTPRQQLVHVYPEASEIGRLLQPTLGVVATHEGFASAVKGLQPSFGWKPARSGSTALACPAMPTMPGPFDLNEAGKHVAKSLRSGSCVTAGAGNYALYAHRHIAFKGLGSQLSPAVGAMGYGLPAAIAAKLLDRQRQVVCFAGDGCFQMTMQELGTAAQYRLGIVVLIFNNGLYGTIKLHQERTFPGRDIATTLINPSFAQLAQSYGGLGMVVTSTEDFASAYEAAQAFAEANCMPAVLELVYDADLILPDRTLTQIRASS